MEAHKKGGRRFEFMALFKDRIIGRATLIGTGPMRCVAGFAPILRGKG